MIIHGRYYENCSACYKYKNILTLFCQDAVKKIPPRHVRRNVYTQVKLMSFSAAAEAARSALGIGKPVGFFKFHAHTGQHNELRYAVAAADCLGFGAVVVKGHYVFAAIVAVAHAHAVGWAEPLLCGKAAAGEHSAEVTLGYGGGDAGADLYGGLGRDDSGASVDAGVEVAAGGSGGGKEGDAGVWAEFFYLDFHFAQLLFEYLD
jgi:hypothetical protein